MNVAYFENLSTTTSMDQNSPTFGKLEIQSIDKLSQGLLGTGNGSSNPIGLARSTLSC